MKRLSILLLPLLLGLGALSPASGPAGKADSPKPDESANNDPIHAGKPLRCQGTITKVDRGARSMTLRQASGKETTCSWDDATKMNGEMKEGATAFVRYRMRGGRLVAMEIRVREAKKGKM